MIFYDIMFRDVILEKKFLGMNRVGAGAFESVHNTLNSIDRELKGIEAYGLKHYSLAIPVEIIVLDFEGIDVSVSLVEAVEAEVERRSRDRKIGEQIGEVFHSVSRGGRGEYVCLEKGSKRLKEVRKVN